MIAIAQETLDFRCAGISPALRLLVPAFSLPYTPRWLAPDASVRMERFLTALDFHRIFYLHHKPCVKFKKFYTKNYYTNRLLCGNQVPTSSVLCLAPLNFRRKISRLVSCYALFKGWLLLSQPPRCIRNFTSFTT